MRKFGLIGYPLGHSFSKKFFTEKFAREQIIDCSYDNYPLTSLDQFSELILSDPALFGLNITIPYKSEVIKYIDNIDLEASEIGAVNVVKIKRTGGQVKLYGYNSDVTGIMDSLFSSVTPELKNALVLGTGGSSRAVCFVLNRLGLSYTLVSRNRKPGLLTYSDLTPDIINKTGLIVNTSPLGMYPDINSKPDINYNLLNEKHILFDLVYNPEITSFLKKGKERGCKIISGLRMLQSQAEKAWEIWNDNNL